MRSMQRLCKFPSFSLNGPLLSVEQCHVIVGEWVGRITEPPRSERTTVQATIPHLSSIRRATPLMSSPTNYIHSDHSLLWYPYLQFSALRDIERCLFAGFVVEHHLGLRSLIPLRSEDLWTARFIEYINTTYHTHLQQGKGYH